MIEMTMASASQLMLVVGVLACIVSVITEVIKGIKLLNRIPTDLVVLVLALVVTLVAFFAYAQYAAVAIAWYMIAAAIVCGFLVAFVAMYGWDKFSELWQRFKPKA